ncbi:hypothetical protein Pint_32927 [Pistacia integerrima]|uniref:Uncharacterized protein n=1 Tax=Pistacia integerrima TaxID=434235 RepID=A0ACC0X6P7_9ROSI|nr:hypothetical protein Pint_32927 [Pistacia integerrima]
MFPPNVQLPEFKPGMIQLLPTFHGLENANPYVPNREFEEVVATFQNRADTIDTVKLRFFPFSVKDNAKVWLYSLRPRSIGSCPHHGFESWRVVSYFYDGLLSRERQFVETMCNGDFLHKDPDEAINFLDDLSEKAHTWMGPNALESTKRNQTTGIYQLREEDNLKAHLEVLTKEIEVLKMKDVRAPKPVARVESHEPCFMCNGVNHILRDCLTYFELREMKEECNNLGILIIYGLYSFL